MCPQRRNLSVCDFSSKVEMGKWIEDLNLAIDMAKKSQEKSSIFLDPGLSDRSNRKFSFKLDTYTALSVNVFLWLFWVFSQLSEQKIPFGHKHPKRAVNPSPSSPLHNFLSSILPPLGSSDEVSLEQESEDDMNSSRTSLDKQTHHRANTTMHVCWHRNTSVSMSDHSLAVEVLLPCPKLHANTTIYIHRHAHNTHQQHVHQTSHLHTSISGVSGNGFAFCFLLYPLTPF